MVVRLKDVAERAGVSIRTVSNVVNDHPYVRDEVRSRVQSAIDELGYRPNLVARQLRRGRTGTIALAVPDLTVPYFAELAGHVLRAADRAGLTLLIEQTEGHRERELTLVRGSQAKAIDGLILSPLAASADDLAEAGATMPLVLLGERIYDTRFDHVAIDNVAAAAEATAHLVRSGRRRIAVIGAHPDHSSAMADLRLQGYRQALADSRIDLDARLVVTTDWFTRHDGYVATQRLLESDADFDAIFCFNDLLAHGAMRALSEAGLRCPEDVALVGVDDNDENAYSTPTLTSVAPSKVDIADRAVALLVSRIDGGPFDAAVDYVPGFTLSVRESAPQA